MILSIFNFVESFTIVRMSFLYKSISSMLISWYSMLWMRTDFLEFIIMPSYSFERSEYSVRIPKPMYRYPWEWLGSYPQYQNGSWTIIFIIYIIKPTDDISVINPLYQSEALFNLLTEAIEDNFTNFTTFWPWTVDDLGGEINFKIKFIVIDCYIWVFCTEFAHFVTNLKSVSNIF